jgi:hypothetical protein
LLRNFTGSKARLKSGPDVFADALVPRNASRSPERPRSACRASGDRRSILPDALHACPDRLRLPRAVADFALAPPRIGYPAQLSPIPSAELLQSSPSVCAADGARETRHVAMVIVVRNGRVNRSSRIPICPCSTGISAISCSPVPRSRLHPVHRDI